MTGTEDRYADIEVDVLDDAGASRGVVGFELSLGG